MLLDCCWLPDKEYRIRPNTPKLSGAGRSRKLAQADPDAHNLELQPPASRSHLNGSSPQCHRRTPILLARGYAEQSAEIRKDETGQEEDSRKSKEW